jgi:hypothetical protein
MSTETIPSSRAPASFTRPLPPIVRIVLTQATRHRRRGLLTTEVFEAQLQRLAREELEPRGLTLLVRELSCGATRFIIKTATGQVCDLFEVTLDDVPA